MAAGVVIEFGSDWVARPYEQVVKDAREGEVAALNNETARLSVEAETARAAIAEANARALEAQVALEKFKAPRTISPEQELEIGEKLKAFAGTPFDFSVNPSPEPQAFAERISQTLKKAGWKRVPFPQGGVVLGSGENRARILISSMQLGFEIDVSKHDEWKTL